MESRLRMKRKMEDLKIEEGLTGEALEIMHKQFNKQAQCDWSIEQFKQSLKNQDYIKFLVFTKDDTLVGIIDYYIDDPWHNTGYSIDYAEDNDIAKYMQEYVENIIKK